MPLSIEKLTQLLEQKGFSPRKYFIMNGICKFVEILSISTIDSYLLHIPEKYKFEPRISDRHLLFKIKQIPILKPENIEHKYAGRMEQTKIAANYDEIELKSQYPHQLKEFDGIDMEDQLTNQYRRPIVLKDVEEADNAVLQCIFRQLTRLRFCVQFLKYKFGIIYKDYLVCVDNKDSIECFKIRNFPESGDRHLYITIDLEVFYENSKVLIDDLDQLQNGIRGVLDKNQDVQTKHLEVMLVKQQNIIKILSILTGKKQQLRFELQRFKELFDLVDTTINKNIQQINSINYSIRQMTGKKQDEQVKVKHNIYVKLTQLYSKKEDIAQSIIFYRKREHHISLNIDRILFDNNVMLDKIFKNLNQLRELND